MAVRCLGDRLFQLSLVGQGVAQADVRVGMIGIEPGGCSCFSDRLVQLPLSEQDAAK